jgi:5'-nucleotidase
MRILVDMDGTIADWETKFYDTWRALHPDKVAVPVSERTTFRIVEQYPPEYRHHVRAVYTSPGFFRTLEPIPGALDAMREMREAGHDVRICTSPLSDYRNCVLEKYEWVEEYLGPDWIGALILTRDKSVVRGDVLVDDRPDVAGEASAEWEHVLYDQPYNQAVPRKRRLIWAAWRSVLESRR